MICGKSDRGIHARSKQTDFILPGSLLCRFFYIYFIFTSTERDSAGIKQLNWPEPNQALISKVCADEFQAISGAEILYGRRREFLKCVGHKLFEALTSRYIDALQLK